MLKKKNVINDKDMKVMSHKCEVSILNSFKTKKWTCASVFPENGGNCVSRCGKEEVIRKHTHDWGCKKCNIHFCVGCLVENRV